MSECGSEGNSNTGRKIVLTEEKFNEAKTLSIVTRTQIQTKGLNKGRGQPSDEENLQSEQTGWLQQKIEEEKLEKGTVKNVCKQKPHNFSSKTLFLIQ